MSIRQGLKWIVLAASGFALSGCVAPPPGAAYDPVVYNDGYADPAPVYYDNSYDPYYVDNTYDPYYAPVYPVVGVGTSVSYNVYNNNRGHRANYRRAERRADRRAERRADRRADRRANRTAEDRAARRADRQARRDGNGAAPAENRGNRRGNRGERRNQRPARVEVPAVARQQVFDPNDPYQAARTAGDQILPDGSIRQTK